MSTLSKLLGKRIREIREAKDIKQVELATMIDVEATNLSKIEKGIHLPKEDNLKKITNALNIDIRELFDFKHFKPKKDLLNEINTILLNLSTEEVQFFYKILNSYKELK